MPQLPESFSTELEITKQRSYVVVKANEIIQRARYDLSLGELKTFSYILSKIKPNDKENQEYVFDVKEYCQVCGIDFKNGQNYKNIKDTLKGLRDKSFWLIDETGRETTIGWLEKVRVNKGSGKITVKLDVDIQKYVLNLFDNYTQYSLLSTLPMQSSYSFRLYELLKSYAFTKQHTFDIDDLKSKVSATHYVNFKDFRKKVIEVAIKEINLYTDIEITWEPINKGKRVIAVKFSILQRDSWGQYWAAQNATNKITTKEHQLTLEELY